MGVLEYGVIMLHLSQIFFFTARYRRSCRRAVAAAARARCRRKGACRFINMDIHGLGGEMKRRRRQLLTLRQVASWSDDGDDGLASQTRCLFVEEKESLESVVVVVNLDS